MRFFILMFWISVINLTLTACGTPNPIPNVAQGSTNSPPANAIPVAPTAPPITATTSNPTPNPLVTLPKLDYLDSLDISQGTLRVVTTEDYDRTIMLDNQLVYKDEDAMLLSLNGKFNIDGKNVILFSGNSGGSGTPHSTYRFITFEGSNYVISEEFDAYLEHEQLPPPQQQGNKIMLQLGRNEGYRVMAIYENGQVTVQGQRLPQTGTAEIEDCENLYSLYTGACVGQSFSDCGIDNSGMYIVRAYNHVQTLGDPRLNFNAFDELCDFSCSKQAQSPLPYAVFSEAVCRSP